MIETGVIHCGECLEVLATFPDNCIDLTVTSPPYDNLRDYNGFVFDFEPIAQQLYRVTKPGGVVVWVVNDQTKNGSESGTSFEQALYFKSIGFRLHDTMIYKKKNSAFFDPRNKRYKSVIEYMFVFSIGSPITVNLIKDVLTKQPGRTVKKATALNQNGSKRVFADYKLSKFQVRGNAWEYTAGRDGWHRRKDRVTSHPAPFPEALARDHIISWSNPGDIVLDPFVGSGTTPAEAKKLNRQYIGIDISAEYCELARRRIASAKVPLPGMEA